MPRNIEIASLVAEAQPLKWSEVEWLHLREAQANARIHGICTNIDPHYQPEYDGKPLVMTHAAKRYRREIDRYLALTSLPWYFGPLNKPKEPHVVEDLVNARLAPFGNIVPRIVVLGYPQQGVDQRVIWSKGKAARNLRQALIKAGVYQECWFTTPALAYRDIKLFKPEFVLALGNKAQEKVHGIPGKHTVVRVKPAHKVVSVDKYAAKIRTVLGA